MVKAAALAQQVRRGAPLLLVAGQSRSFKGPETPGGSEGLRAERLALPQERQCLQRNKRPHLENTFRRPWAPGCCSSAHLPRLRSLSTPEEQRWPCQAVREDSLTAEGQASWLSPGLPSAGDPFVPKGMPCSC